MNFKIKEEWIFHGEYVAEKIIRKSKNVLPHIGRFLLVSTFIEDAFRMYYQWNDQRQYLETRWNLSFFLSNLIIFYNLVAQLGGSIMTLAKFRSFFACGILFSVIILQVIIYSIFNQYESLTRYVALCGSLLLLLVKQDDNKRIMAGLPMIYESNHNKYTQLVARILLVVMFIFLIKFELNVLNMLQLIIGGLLLLCVFIGFKTKLSALLLVCWLSLINLTVNRWWKYSSDTYKRDILKYDFFQILSVIGGLMLVVAYGPGDVSVDEHKKKNW